MTENRGHFAQFYCKYKNVSSSDYKIILLLIVTVTMTIEWGLSKKEEEVLEFVSFDLWTKIFQE